MFYEISANAPVGHFEMSNNEEVGTYGIFQLAMPMAVPAANVVAEGYCSCGCGEKTVVVKMGATENGCMYMRVFDADRVMRKAA